eukprot:TRINITY_DN24891_c0_g2_i1.p1 TRINITY_DN24891_c0_g2~~TRINITY_DN24891_c0_g2_i1.p1  ORF type:complete len:1032 (-),score=317.37 TRINITY_DN24891_c0_g2_i1:154-3249(-)
MALSTLAFSRGPTAAQLHGGASLPGDAEPALKQVRQQYRGAVLQGGLNDLPGESPSSPSSSTYARGALALSTALAAAAAPAAGRELRRKGQKLRHRAGKSVALKASAPVTQVAQPEIEKIDRTSPLGKSLEQENEELLEVLAKHVDDVNLLEEEMEKLSNDELREKTAELKRLIMEKNADKVEGELLYKAIAVLREAVWRVLEIWYYDVQILGGLVLHDGRLAEMKTGEGKTVVALIPTFIAALQGKGAAFVVTPNDYLARRDAENVGQVLRFLGVSVGLVQSTMNYKERQTAYECDVVYLTNAELGFDYLRDNLAVYERQVTQQKNFFYCLVDEADSILIDEARTPLIISESVPAVPQQFQAAREVAMSLEPNNDYNVDLKNMNVFITDKGEKQAEKLLGVENLWNPEEAWILYVLNALRAKELFKNGEQYIVRDGKVAIVDTFTGRVLEGRRWADGMHQAIECKEKIDPSVRSQVSASMTYQALFRLFPKLCAMTGTALTESGEFEDIYGLRCTAVPTARPNVRRDYPDVIYKKEEAKLESIVNEIVRNNERNGRPILIGTSNVKMSEEIVSRLNEQGIFPQLLNARKESVARESEIISQAGRLGMVTVSTNMAGRGVDIILGGNTSAMAQLRLRAALCEVLLEGDEAEKVPEISEEFYPIPVPSSILERLDVAVQAIASCERGMNTQNFLQLEELVALVAGEAPFDQNASYDALLAARSVYRELKSLFKESLQEERKRVIEAGGLYVLGTTRHESRRIDNQLRGRAGRQGDPGTTRFFISLQDEVFRVFGGEKVETLMDRFRLGDEVPLESQIVTDTLDRVQKAVEEFFKKTRGTLFEFDKVISKQRELTYAVRKQYVIAPEKTVQELVEEWSGEAVSVHLETVEKKALDMEARKKEFTEYFGYDMPELDADPLKVEAALQADVLRQVREKWAFYDDWRPGFGAEAARIATVVTIDDEWKALLQRMEALKQTVGLATYKGSDPLREYQVEGFKMYQKAEGRYKARSVSRWLRSKPKADVDPNAPPPDA